MMKELIREDLPPRSVHEYGILAPGKSKVFAITSTPKKHPEEANARSD
jgi:hypothetical protein